MSFFGRLINLFTRSGRADELLQQGVELAKANRAQDAIDIYDSLLNTTSISQIVRARALFNRALAHSSLNADPQAIADLQQVVAMRAVPQNVLAAAKTQLARVQKRAKH